VIPFWYFLRLYLRGAALNSDYQIDFIDSVYIRNIYYDIIPRMSDYYNLHQDRSLVFNFSELKFLSPSVIPHLLNFADIYKTYCNKKIRIDLAWTPKLLSYLYYLGFFSYANKYELFSFKDDLIGGFDSYETEENCQLIISPVNSTEEEINVNVNELLKTMSSYNRANTDGFVNNRDGEIIRDIFFHLIHNANIPENGRSNAFGVFQINRYIKDKHGGKPSEKRVSYITIVDNGVGLKHSIQEKFLASKTLPNRTLGISNNLYIPVFTSSSNTTLDYIMEAIFWRKNFCKSDHGLCSVIKMVFEKEGKIGIHSDDTYIVLTKENFEHYFNNAMDVICGVELADRPRAVPAIPSNLRRYGNTIRYRGVHIDIELPLGEKK
jgi:hypothetical protein